MCDYQLQDEVPGTDLCKAIHHKPKLRFVCWLHHLLLELLCLYHDLTFSESRYMSPFVSKADSLIPELHLSSF